MASFYDRPAESNIINTYVAAPYQEILQAGLARQGRYDETLSALQANQEYLDQLQALEGSGQAEYLNQSRAGIEDISTSFANKDLSDPFIRRQLRDEIRRRIDPTRINNIVQSQKNLAERNKMIAEYDARGLYYEPYERTQDPYYTKQLSADEVYNYTPRAFQDPDEMIIKRFKSLPVKESSGIVGNQVMRYESNKDAIDQTMNETVRNIKDSVQGQWIITQAKLNGTYTGDDNSTVQAYVESLRPEYTIDNKIQQGFVPEYMLKGGDDKLPFTGGIPLINRNLGAQPLDKEETNFKQFQAERGILNSKIEEIKDQLKVATPEQLPKLQSELQQQQSLLDFKNSQEEAILKERGIDKTEIENSSYKEIQKAYGKSLSSSDLKLINDQAFGKNAMSGDEFKEFLQDAGPTASTAYSAALSNTVNYDKLLKQGIKESQIIPKSYQESVFVAPQVATKSGIGYVNNPLTEKETQSQSYALLKSMQENPDPLKVSVISGSDRKLKEFAKAKDFEYNQVSAMPDKDGWYVTVGGKDENGKRTGVNYKLYLTTASEREALGKDFLENGNYLQAWKMLNPSKAEYIRDHKREKNIYVPVADYSSGRDVNLINVRLEHLPNGKYKVYDPSDPTNSTPELSLEQANEELYRMEFESLKQNVSSDKQLYMLLNAEYNRNSR